MDTEALQLATIHPDTLADERLHLETRHGFSIYCPRHEASAQLSRGGYVVLRHPVDLIEFLKSQIREKGISDEEITGIYLAANSVRAEMAGDHDAAKRLNAEHEQLMSARQAVKEAIKASGIELQLFPAEMDEIPF